MVNNMLNNITTYFNSKEYQINILKNKVHILNYKSVIDVTSECILIKVEDNITKINGENLLLVKMDNAEILITGIIKGVTINEWLLSS